MTFLSNFFYHDSTLKRKWVIQNLEGYFDETDFGPFKKERYPFGFLSAFIFIDHCDFDTPEKVEAVFYGTSDKNSKDYGKKGIVGTGLTATKTIFVDGSGTENVGLENKNYRNVIEKLAKDGIEVSPHSLIPKSSLRRNDPKLDVCLGEMKKFVSQTWVDHGYGLHNIIRFGWNRKSPYFILDKLLEKDYRFFWSRIDYSLNAPDGNLNVFNFQGRAGKDYWLKIVRLIRERQKFSKTAFVFFWDFVGSLIGWEAKDDLVFSADTTLYYLRRFFGKKCLPPQAFSKKAPVRTLLRLINPLFYLMMVRNFFSPDKITGLTAGFYPVRLNDGKVVFFFNSLWINDCDTCYQPVSVDRLIKENGLHIGHNYFCVDEKHYLNLSFKKNKNHYNISDRFQKNLEYLAKCQKEKKVWVTTVRDSGQYYSLWAKVQCNLGSEDRLLIFNTGDKKIFGFTLSKKCLDRKKSRINFSETKKFKKKIVGDRIFLWIDLEPYEKLTLTVL